MRVAAAIVLAAFSTLAQAAPAQDVLERQRQNDAQRHYQEGEQHMYREAFEDAVREFKRAVELDPRHVLAHYSLGQAYMALKRYPAAVEAYVSCRETLLGLASLDQRARADVDRRRRDEIHDLQQQLDRLRTGKVKGVSGDMGPQVMAVEQRLRVLKDADLRGAEQEIRIPAELTLALGSAYFRLGQLVDAEREYRAALKADSKLGAAHNNLAVICMLTERFAEAREAVAAAEKNGFRVSEQFKRDLEQRARSRQN